MGFKAGRKHRRILVTLAVSSLLASCGSKPENPGAMYFAQFNSACDSASQSLTSMATDFENPNSDWYMRLANMNTALPNLLLAYSDALKAAEHIPQVATAPALEDMSGGIVQANKAIIYAGKPEEWQDGVVEAARDTFLSLSGNLPEVCLDIANTDGF